MSDRASLRALTVCGIILAVTAGGWVLNISQGIVIPIILGALVAFLLSAVAQASARIPVIGPMCPNWLRMGISFLFVFLLLMLAVAMVARNLDQASRVAPGYGIAFGNLITTTADKYGWEVDVTWHGVQSLLGDGFQVQALVRYGLSAISGSLAYIFLVFIYALFFLIEGHVFEAKLVAIFRTEETRERARQVSHLITAKVGSYMALKTLVNAILALACFAVLWVFGIDMAAFWAILTGVFNYIPYVGSLIAVLLPVFVSVGQYESMETTISLAMLLILMQNIVGYYIEPRLLGKQLNLSPLVIMISLAAWGTMWGIAGAILSVPLTAAMMILCGAFPRSYPVAVLLSEDGNPPGSKEMRASD